MNPYGYSDTQMHDHIVLCLRVLHRRFNRIPGVSFEAQIKISEPSPNGRIQASAFELINCRFMDENTGPRNVQVVVDYGACSESLDEGNVISIYEHVARRVAGRLNTIFALQGRVPPLQLMSDQIRANAEVGILEEDG